MSLKFSVWSYCDAPPQRQWMSVSKRGTRTSIGPIILLAAAVVVAGVIGISGIDPQVIDAEWVQDAAGARLPKISLSKRSGIVAAIPLPPRRAVTTGEATISSPSPVSATELSQPRTSIAGVDPAAETEEPPLAVAVIPDAEAKADALPPQPAPAVAARPAERPRFAATKKKVVREHHQRSYAGAYAQYGGRGWPGGGWPGFQSRF
jgi:hypothetical protein